MPAAYTWDELRGADLYWLLTLDLRGVRYRFSTVDLSVPYGSDTLHYIAGMNPLSGVSDAVALPGGGVSDRSVDIDLLFSRDTAAGYAALAAGDQDLGDATGELALWIDGGQFEDRQVVLTGYLDSLTYGALGEPVSFVITSSPWEKAGAVIPSDSAIVNADTWPLTANAATHTIGTDVSEQSYPIVIGALTLGVGPAGQEFSATPGLIVEIPNSGDNTSDHVTVLIAGTPTSAGATGTEVRIHNMTQNTSALVSSSQTTDNLGRTVTICQWIAGAGGPTVGDSAELWVSWPNAAGALPSLRGSGSMRGAGEVLSYLLSRSAIEVDTAGLRALEPQIDGYLIDTHINEQVSPWDLIEDSLIPLLPIVWRIGPRGLTAHRWPWNADHSQALAAFDTSQDCERISMVSRSSAQEVYNRIAITYATNADTGDPVGRLSYAATKRADQTDTEINPYSIASERRFGDRTAPDIAAGSMVMDTSTARAVLDWRLRWACSTHETVAISAPQQAQALIPGSVVTLTDTEIGWTDRLCAVVGLRRGPGRTEIDLVHLNDFIRDAPTQ